MAVVSPQSLGPSRDLNTRSTFRGSVARIYALGLALVALVAFPSAPVLFDGACCVASAVGLLQGYEFVRHPERLRFSTFYAMSILLAYGLGSVVFLVGNRTLYATSDQLLYVYGLTFDQSGLSRALALCLGACLLLYGVGRLEPSFSFLRRAERLDLGRSERLVWFGTLVVLAAVGDGSIQAVNVVGSSTTGHESILGSVAVYMLTAVVPLGVMVYALSDDRWRRIRVGSLLALCALTVLLLDRRYLLYVAALALLAASVAVPGIASRFRRRPLLIVVGVILIYLGFQFILALRLAEAQYGPTSQVGTVQLVGKAADILASGDSANGPGVNQVTGGESNSSRPFILAYFGGLVDIGSPMMDGAEASYSVKFVVPSAIDPTKLANLPQAVEELSHPLYGIPVFNGPHTDLISGYDDFGDFGVLLYPALAALLYRVFYVILCRLVKTREVRLIAWLALMFQIFFIQHNLNADFETVRDLVIIAIVTLAVARLPLAPIRRSSPGLQRPSG